MVLSVQSLLDCAYDGNESAAFQQVAPINYNDDHRVDLLVNQCCNLRARLDPVER